MLPDNERQEILGRTVEGHPLLSPLIQEQLGYGWEARQVFVAFFPYEKREN